ncbi:LacI family DNA-binding transcriptional regulator [Bifidobacterium sp. UBA744]|uniref:LacI family DNA-binding transcriptional regulator n=1 Tax=Bifidobacterium sp. UBA744 TaxID=1946112 RepID=UPI0025B7EFC3|nr:LacI family DNA-binding transcriptional regulator [Bifidobacterium sp. UBA744]
MGKRVTITDVAREAGVSIKTVSNVINETGSMRPDTRARVQETMKRLGYRLNVSARAMKAGRTKLIGLALAGFGQPFMPYLADSVIVAARERGYGVIADTYGDGNVEDILAETYRMGADGWIFFPAHGYASAGTLDQPYPVVTVGDFDPVAVGGDADWVTMPNTAAVTELTGRLLDAGNRVIATMGTCLNGVGEEERARLLARRDGATAQRVRGVVQAHRQRGMEPDWRYMTIPAGWNRVGGAQGVRALLASELPLPDAIICLNDASALGVISELQKHGIQVPGDVRVTGFDNVPDAEFSTPALTTIDPDVIGYAKSAVDMLVDRIEGYDGPARKAVTDYRVVVRGSAVL